MLLEKLKHYKSIKIMVMHLENEKEELLTKATKTSAVISETTSRTNKVGDKVGDNAVLLAELEKTITDYNKEQEQELIDIINLLKQIEHPYCAILFSKFIRNMTLEQIAEEMNYSLSQIKRHYKKAKSIAFKDDTF